MKSLEELLKHWDKGFPVYDNAEELLKQLKAL